MSDKPNTYEVDKCGLVLSREDIARENTYVAMQDYDELKAKLTAAQEDARRYQWLRDIGDETWNAISKRGISASDCDAAIDRALAQRKGGSDG